MHSPQYFLYNIFNNWLLNVIVYQKKLKKIILKIIWKESLVSVAIRAELPETLG